MRITSQASLAALAASAVLLASPAIALAQSAAPVASADVTARANSQLTPEVNTALTDALVAQVAAQMGPLGDPVSFTLRSEKDVSGYKVYVYRAAFKSTSLDENFALDAQGKIAGLRFVPVTTP